MRRQQFPQATLTDTTIILGTQVHVGGEYQCEVCVSVAVERCKVTRESHVVCASRLTGVLLPCWQDSESPPHQVHAAETCDTSTRTKCSHPSHAHVYHPRFDLPVIERDHELVGVRFEGGDGSVAPAEQYSTSTHIRVMCNHINIANTAIHNQRRQMIARVPFKYDRLWCI